MQDIKKGRTYSGFELSSHRMLEADRSVAG